MQKPECVSSLAANPMIKITFQFEQGVDNEFIAFYSLNDVRIGEAFIQDITKPTLSLSKSSKKTIESKTAYIDKMFIKSAYQKKGYGPDFLRFILEELKELGFKKIELKVQPFKVEGAAALTLDQLQKFYQQFGFSKEDKENYMACDVEQLRLATIPYYSNVKTTTLKKLLVIKSYTK